MSTRRSVAGAAGLAIAVITVMQGAARVLGEWQESSAQAAVAPWMLGQVVIVPGDCYDRIQTIMVCYEAALNCSRHETDSACLNAGTGYWLEECPHVWSVQALSSQKQVKRLDVTPNGCGYRDRGSCYWFEGVCFNGAAQTQNPCNGVVHHEVPPTGGTPPCPDA